METKNFFEGKVYMTADKETINRMIEVLGQEKVEDLYSYFFEDCACGFLARYTESGETEDLMELDKIWSRDFEEDYNDIDECGYYASTAKAYEGLYTGGWEYCTNPIWGYCYDIDESAWYALDEDDESMEKLRGIDDYDGVLQDWYILGIADGLAQIFGDRYMELAQEETCETE